jgi:bacteriocin biosynthesis cyclodehydratase domain-containing protein
MPVSESINGAAVRLKNTYGVFVLGPDDVEFRTGSLSGPSCVVSDSGRRGLLADVIKKLLFPEEIRRNWNQSETELLGEIIPQLQENGIVEGDASEGAPIPGKGLRGAALQKPLADAHIAIVGHGVLGKAIHALLESAPCGSITMCESSSVAGAGDVTGRDKLPQGASEWKQAIRNCDWVIAAQDCFEPEELAALNKASLDLGIPWSLVCFDGYEGWVGPTFVPGQTACFTCFRQRLFASAGEPKYVFMDPSVRVHRVPSPWLAGPATAAWVNLITSMFALELVAVTEGHGFTLNHMLIVNRLNLTFERESLLRLPRCPDCSRGGGGPRVNVFANLLKTRPEGA